MFNAENIKNILEKNENIIIFVILSLFACLAFYLRTLNIETLISPGYGVVNLVGNDPWYSLRQIELVVSNGFQYSYFDPYTYYPYGDVIHWGPVFPMICGAVSMICGAVSTYDISYWSSFVPPLFAAFIVFVVYGITKKLTNNNVVSLVSALLSGIIYGQYYYRSIYGFIDHHITEVFFGSLFILLYICLTQLSYKEDKNKFIAVALMAGAVYTLGFYNIPTMVLFAGIIILFTVVWCIYTYICVDELERTIDYLKMLALVFFIPLVSLLIFGYTPDLYLNRYSFGHVLLYSVICIAIPALCSVIIKKYEKYMSEHNAVKRHGNKSFKLCRWHLVVAAVCFIGIVFTTLLLTGNEVVAYIITAFNNFFGNTSYSNTISEARAWTIAEAFAEYGFGIGIATIGFILMLVEIIRTKKPEWMLVAIWCFVMFYSTMKHVRYDYYLTINICVLIGLALHLVYKGLNFKTIRKWLNKTENIGGEKPASKHNQDSSIITKSKKNIAKYKQKNVETYKKDRNKYYMKSGTNLAKISVTLILIILTVVFAITSVILVTNISTQIGGGIDAGRYECMEWLGNNTPETGVNYYGIYDEETFVYPDESYGVASWWDYGHWITTVAHRIPVANTFQHGVNGADLEGNGSSEWGVAGIFVTTDENHAVGVIENLGVKYIFTDYQMASDKFWAMATWYESGTTNNYIMNVPLFDGLQFSRYIRVYNETFYDSMAVRLHNFDGSFRPAMVTGYVKPAEGLGGIYDYGEMPINDIHNMSSAGENIYIAGLTPYNTTHDVESLKHFRLIHESEQFSVVNDDTKIAFGKIFEYVEGAKINMTMGGTMYIPVITNTGREFLYVQNSYDGQFIAPYSTSGGIYDTGVVPDEFIYIQTFDGKRYKLDVTENEVANGSVIEMGRMMSF